VTREANTLLTWLREGDAVSIGSSAAATKARGARGDDGGWRCGWWAWLEVRDPLEDAVAAVTRLEQERRGGWR